MKKTCLLSWHVGLQYKTLTGPNIVHRVPIYGRFFVHRFHQITTQMFNFVAMVLSGLFIKCKIYWQSYRINESKKETVDEVYFTDNHDNSWK